MKEVVYSIDELIPQRAPIQMVDALVCASEDEAVCRYSVKRAGFFIEPDGLLSEVAMVEHIAQSASAHAGWKAREAGATEPPIGYIGEVKNFHLYRRPAVGETIMTKVSMGPEVQGVTLMRGESKVGEEVVADTQMKIYVPEG